MIKDELKTLERYTEDLEALRHYPQVKAERDSLAVEAAQLNERVTQLSVRANSEAYTRAKVSSQYKKKESEFEELSRKLEKAEKELFSLKDFKAKVPGSGGLTLGKMKKQFLQAQEAEIEARTMERVGKIEKEMSSKLPVLVQEELIRGLNRPNLPPEIDKVVNDHARQIADEVLHDKKRWPEWFKDYFVQQVEDIVGRQMDLEFEDKVKLETQKRLDAMKTGQWDLYTAGKAKSLAVSLRTLVNELKGTRWFTCDRCQRRLALDIGQLEIGHLLEGKTLDITCSACFDMSPPPFFLSSVPHKVAALNLAGLLQQYLGETPPAGQS